MSSSLPPRPEGEPRASVPFPNSLGLPEANAGVSMFPSLPPPMAFVPLPNSLGLPEANAGVPMFSSLPPPMASIPFPIPLGLPEANADALRKRGRDPATSGDPLPPPKRSAAPSDVFFRVVVPSKQIGRVIGKEGSRIQQIRAETGATIKIADAASQHEERAIIISSGDENEISNAESALLSIARLILKENEDKMEVSNTGAGHVAANTIRLLIAGSQAGGLIGISGQNIQYIRNFSGATVTVLAQNQLPFCACAHESDRIVQVSGNAPEVLKALEKIACKLRENPPSKVISMMPRYNHVWVNPGPLPPPPQSSADHVTSEMMIMEKLVGGLIGKNGYNISKIRHASGATIKVSGAKGGGEQRLIQFGGSALQVTLARTMVENFIFSQVLPQNLP